MDPDTVTHLFNISKNVGCCATGLVGTGALFSLSSLL